MRLYNFACALFSCATITVTAQAETLTILHTNDLHSRIEPINKYNSACSPENNLAGKCYGGWARLKTAVEIARSKAPNSLLVSGGDQFQGTLFYTYYKGTVAAEMMNSLGYDAMTAGNHEFDDGPEVLQGFVKKVNFPVLLSNADVMKERFLSDALMPSYIVEKAGEKIGLLGLTPEDLPSLASPGDNIAMQNPVTALKREIASLKQKGVKRIIVLSHSGFGVDQRIAQQVDDIDLIVGGHSNTFLSNIAKVSRGPYPTWVTTPNGGRTAIVQAYAYGKYLGRIDLDFDQDGVVVKAKGEPIPVDKLIKEDAKTKQRVAELAKPLDKIRQKVVGFTKKPIDGDGENCRVAECTMGTLVTDALLSRFKSQGAEIAIINGGGLRASINAGHITMGEVLEVLPFQNTVATFSMTGADIVTSLESGVSGIEDLEGRFPQVAGLRYAVNASKKAGNRISMVHAKINGEWKPIDANRHYNIVTIDFLRSGGDGYELFDSKAKDPYDFGPNIENVVADYLISAGDYEPTLRGQIIIE